ncbi:cytochrome P450 [Patellaria atrata CBS 101060]|uniref:Cytochrome P450 n=1 Tax=Patellaria atrata CBS 101060 TaxID=1346257 RepID=A0A9P4VVD6_9PEZI|nr:cytochrome P450 [Patellaria atrata CBS 101060]
MLELHSFEELKSLLSLILASVIGTGLIYVLAVVLYRLTFHPLAKYPGPFLAKITAWYDVYHAYKGDKHIHFVYLHEKYGTFVRFGPNKLSINHPEALKAIYGHRANTRKSDFYLAFPAAKGVVSTHTAIDRQTHSRKRRVLSYAFSDSALKGMEEYVLVHIRDYLNKLVSASSEPNGSANGHVKSEKSGWSEAKDVATWTNYMSFDILGDLCFGKPFGMLAGNVENRHMIYLLTQAVRRHNITGPMPALHQTGFDKILLRKIYNDRQQYLAFSRAMVGARSKAGIMESERKDFFWYILRSKDPETGQGFSSGELWGESNTLIVAGSDTSSITISSTIFYLLHNPDCLTRLTTEIDSKFASAEDIRSGPVLNSCTYLRACVDEALRMSPPVGGLLERYVLPGGLTVLGHQIPAGTDLGTPIYAIHHHPDYVPNAYTYDPSRWSSETGSPVDLEKLHSVFNPFSIGPRGCIGKPMGYLEVTLTLARLVWGYEMRLAPGEAGMMGEGRKGLGWGREREGEFQTEEMFVSKVRGPVVQFRERMR